MAATRFKGARKIIFDPLFRHPEPARDPGRQRRRDDKRDQDRAHSDLVTNASGGAR